MYARRIGARRHKLPARRSRVNLGRRHRADAKWIKLRAACYNECGDAVRHSFATTRETKVVSNIESLDVARRAEQIYDERLKSELEREHLHRYVAVEPDSGDYYLGNTLSEAIQAARGAHPERLAFAIRVGHLSTIHLGVLATRPVKSTPQDGRSCR
jgi:hypothetical protein